MPGKRGLANIQRRQAVHNFQGLQADCDDAPHQLQRVAGIVHGLNGPVIGVVHDASISWGCHDKRRMAQIRLTARPNLYLIYKFNYVGSVISSASAR